MLDWTRWSPKWAALERHNVPWLRSTGCGGVLGRSVALLVLLAVSAPALGDDRCTPQWIPTFGEFPGPIGTVRASARLVDESGERVVIGGSFFNVGATLAHNVAIWDGTAWSSMGGDSAHVYENGLNGDVHALVVFDDGSGPSVYAAGNFTATGDGSVALGRVARWDGSQWLPVGTPSSPEATPGMNGSVETLAVIDLGGGPSLYAGGIFSQADGQSASRLARLVGGTWTAVGPALSGSVRAIHTVDDGRGTVALVVAGSFYFYDQSGTYRKYIARLDKGVWAPLGEGLLGAAVLSMGVWSMDTIPGGPGGTSMLVVGGDFSVADGAPASNIAAWDGTSWSTFGTGANFPVRVVRHLGLPNDDGAALHVGGHFTSIDGHPVSGIARWDGSAWVAIGGGATNGAVRTLLVTDSDSGDSTLLAAGEFTLLGGAGIRSLGFWDGAKWSGVSNGLTGAITALAVHDEGGGDALYVGGVFDPGSDGSPRLLRRWDGVEWSAVGDGVNGTVSALITHDDGSGRALYAGGAFTEAGGVAAHRIARWDGNAWTPLGSGLNGSVSALASFNDGSGSGADLYVIGAFTEAGGVPAARIARWDGTSWSAVGSGLDAEASTLAPFDDGRGPALYVGGSFQTAGGVPASRIARYAGDVWSSVGASDGAGGVAGGSSPQVRALRVFDDGGGPALYVGGRFTLADGVPAANVARWTGTGWQSIGAGLSPIGSGSIGSLLIYDDGSGPALYAASGTPLTDIATGTILQGVARFNGVNWSEPVVTGGAAVMMPLGPRMVVFDDQLGAGPTLIVGSFATPTSPAGDAFIARYGGCAPSLPQTGDLNGDGVVDSSDLGLLLAAWATGSQIADINGDGLVDATDLGLLLANWSVVSPLR